MEREQTNAHLVYTAFVSLDGVVDSPAQGSSERHRSAVWIFDGIEFVEQATLIDDDLVDNGGQTTILRSLDDVAALEDTDGGPTVIHGIATPVRTLSDAGLIDRYHCWCSRCCSATTPGR